MRPVAPQPETRRLRLAHISMQFSDAPRAVRQDARRLFDRFEAKGIHVITGTEAGDEKVYVPLKEQAALHGYRFHRERSVWVAVRKDFIKPRTFSKGYVPVLESWEGVGMHGDRGIAWVAFDTEDLGRITVGAGHYLTKGRPSAIHAANRANLPLNKRMARAIGKWAKKAGRGKALVFYGGDQNILDRVDDTFFGEPMTSAWDELGKWENTGHGCIDVIASYDKDSRVVARRIYALDDKEFQLHTDHYLVEAVFDVQTIR